MTKRFHDSFIPESEEFCSAVWMNKTIDAIIIQAQIWMCEKAKKVGFDSERLYNLKN